MLSLSRPRNIHKDGSITWHDEPKKLHKLYTYSVQDVAVGRELEKRLVDLTVKEWDLWRLDQQINDRGIQVDIPGIKKAFRLIELEKPNIDSQLVTATNSAVTSCGQVGKLKDWCGAQGFPVDGVGKEAVEKALSHPEIPDHVRRALELRREFARSSTSKLKKIQNGVLADGRVRGTLQYHGASTGRWAGRRAQPQNMPRPTLSKLFVEDILSMLFRDEPDTLTLERIRLFYGPPMSAVSNVLRRLVTAAPGHDLIAADFSNIEGRALAWLAGAEWKLEIFRAFDRGEGEDPYLIGAARILDVLGTPPQQPLTEDSPERQSYGKTPELACGYQGGVNSFKKMGDQFGIQFSEEEARTIVNGWRETNPEIVQYWRDLENAAILAVKRAGSFTQAGVKGREVTFRKAGSFLWCRLPSGRCLCYPYPEMHRVWMTNHEGRIRRIKPTEIKSIEAEGWDVWEKDSLTHMKVADRKWIRHSTYGGHLAENVTQAVCRDLLAEALTRVSRHYAVTFHVHDEIVVESPHNVGSVAEVESLMCASEPWGAGLPVAAKGWRGERYRK